MLFWNLLHNPDVMQRASAEIEQNLSPMTSNHMAYPFSSVEQHLPYLRSCIRESFRITPVFTMALERRVVDDDMYLNGQKIPKGVSSLPLVP
jgi:cytochrome P450